MYDYDNMLEVRLQDINHKGEERPWRINKIKAIELSEAYKRNSLRYECWRSQRYSERIADCATYLEFLRDSLSGELQLLAANFCKVRLCPMCNWRRSLRLFKEVSDVIDRVQDKYQNLRPVFLTLTIKNPTHEELNDIIRHMIQSWRRLTEHRTFREQIDGWYRTLEITYNIKDDTFHPHLHVILMVDKRYFSKSNDKYIDIYKWVYLWRMSAKLDYDPVCWIRRVNQKKGNQYKAIAEIVKYCTKDSDYLKSAKYKNSVTRDEVVHTLTKALYRKQLFAYGGKMSEGTKKDAYDKIEHDTSDEIRDDIAHLIERYRWQAGANDYVYRRW